jgi:hypothetical protein
MRKLQKKIKSRRENAWISSNSDDAIFSYIILCSSFQKKITLAPNRLEWQTIPLKIDINNFLRIVFLEHFYYNCKR